MRRLSLRWVSTWRRDRNTGSRARRDDSGVGLTRLNPQVEAAARILRKTRGWADDEIVLLYSGNMGRAHSATEFAALAEHLRQVSPRCRFVFAGDGPARAAWARRWSDRFEFMPAVPGDAAAHLRAADVHLVSQKPAWQGIVVPSKFPAASGRTMPFSVAGRRKRYRPVAGRGVPVGCSTSRLHRYRRRSPRTV